MAPYLEEHGMLGVVGGSPQVGGETSDSGGEREQGTLVGGQGLRWPRMVAAPKPFSFWGARRPKEGAGVEGRWRTRARVHLE